MSSSSVKNNITLPSFIKKVGTTNQYTCECRECVKFPLAPFADFESVQNHLQDTSKIYWFKCPVPHCTHSLPTLSSTITTHIKEKHPKISGIMQLEHSGRTAIYCNDCNSYTTFLHYHCYECRESPYFRSKEERDSHLKEDHSKWWLEHDCKYGEGCHGYHSGACGFNHDRHAVKFIDNSCTVRPSSMCRYDRPWDKVRCLREKCSFDHFWGRVRFLIKLHKPKTSFEDDCCECIDTNPDRPSKVISCEKHSRQSSEEDCHECIDTNPDRPSKVISCEKHA